MINSGLLEALKSDPLFPRDEGRCRRITRTYAKTFAFAARCLPRRARRHAYAVYAFCRWADHAVDEAPNAQAAEAGLERVQRTLDLLYREESASLPEFRTLRRSTIELGIPRIYFERLIEGMRFDLDPPRLADDRELDHYCYCVAGVVGLMMAHVFGYRNECCLPSAERLGRAMQLTNILRDVGEDLDRGRLYLPATALETFGVTEDQLGHRVVSHRFRELMAHYIGNARADYREAERGIEDLIGVSSRLTALVMSRLYGAILDEIERLDFDVFQRRARVSPARKLRILVACLGITAVREWERLRRPKSSAQPPPAPETVPGPAFLIPRRNHEYE